MLIISCKSEILSNKFMLIIKHTYKNTSIFVSVFNAKMNIALSVLLL